MKIEWEGTYGYGDIAGAINYALTVDNMLDEEVELIFRWYQDRKFYPPEAYYSPNDPETVMERTEYILSHFDPESRIKISHQHLPAWTGSLVYRPRFHNRVKIPNWWSTQNPYISSTSSRNQRRRIVIWTPGDNIDPPVDDPGFRYKDPFTVQGIWREFYKMVNLIWRQNYDVELVGYRQPIDQVLDAIKKADLCVGYEGIGNVIAKVYWKPLVVTSTWPVQTRATSGNWAWIIQSLENELMDPESIIENQLPDIKQAEKEYWNKRESILTGLL